MEPKHDPSIERFLRLIGGKQYPAIVAWLVGCTTDLKKPAPVLVLVGPRQSGKTLLVNGLARLWHKGGPNRLEFALGKFCTGLAVCPLVVQDGAMEIRPAIDLATQRNKRIERKGFDPETLGHSLRVVTTHLEQPWLVGRYPRSRTVLVIRTGGAVEHITGRTRKTLGRWVEGGAIAAHVLALRA